MFDAVIRSKLVYGLEAVNLTPSLVTKLNAIQFKGLRKILGMDHTFINRSNTNTKLLQNANSFKNPNQIPNKDIRPFGEYIQSRQEALLEHTVRAPNDDPLRESMLRYNSPMPLEPIIRRVGRPKVAWAQSVYERIWVKNGFGSAQSFKSGMKTSILQMQPHIMNRTL